MKFFRKSCDERTEQILYKSGFETSIILLTCLFFNVIFQGVSKKSLNDLKGSALIFIIGIIYLNIRIFFSGILAPSYENLKQNKFKFFICCVIAGLEFALIDAVASIFNIFDYNIMSLAGLKIFIFNFLFFSISFYFCFSGYLYLTYKFSIKNIEK